MRLKGDSGLQQPTDTATHGSQQPTATASHGSQQPTHTATHGSQQSTHAASGSQQPTNTATNGSQQPTGTVSHQRLGSEAYHCSHCSAVLCSLPALTAHFHSHAKETARAAERVSRIQVGKRQTKGKKNLILLVTETKKIILDLNIRCYI